MWNATEIYKQRLINKIQSIMDKYGDKEWDYALQTVIDIIESNDIEPVVDEPHKVKVCK